MTKEEITEIFKRYASENGIAWYDEENEDNNFAGCTNGPDYIVEIIGDEIDDPRSLKDGTIISCEESFGGEGQGEDYWYVYSIKIPNKEKIFIRYVGYYCSSNGHEWDDNDIDSFEFVKPTQVMKIDWEPI